MHPRSSSRSSTSVWNNLHFERVEPRILLAIDSLVIADSWESPLSSSENTSVLLESSEPGSNLVASLGDIQETSSLAATAAWPVSDDFSSGSLNTDVWTFIDPLGDASLQFTGAGTADAWAEIHVPAGVSHQPFGINNAPRLMQPADDTDFVLEAKFESPLTKGYQLQGILVEQNSDNYLRFDFHHTGSELRIYAASVKSARPKAQITQPVTIDLPMYMRVQRAHNHWTLFYSQDRLDWVEAGSFNMPMKVARVGVFAGNYSTTTAPAHTAKIDYFFETSRPIENEDFVSVDAVDDAYQTNEEAALVVDASSGVLANDIDGQPPVDIFAELVAGPSQGSLVLAPDGSFEYVPSPGAVGEDYFTYNAVDPISGASDTATASIQILSTTVRPISDDFSSGSLNTDLWTFVNPLGDASLQFTGAGTADAWAEIHVPAGATHQPFNGVNNAPRIMQPADDTDFVIETKFESAVTKAYQLQGMLVEQDSNNYLRFDFHSTGSTVRIYAASIENLNAVTKILTPITIDVPMTLRVERVDDLWKLYYSDDGIDWVNAGSFTKAIEVSQVGVFAGNFSSTSAPAHTAKIDYFFESSRPIDNEDGVVNAPPWIANPLANLNVAQDAADTLIDVSDVFEDDDPLTLSVSSSNPGLVTPSLDGTILTLSYAAVGSGLAEIVVRATDSEGLFTEESFNVNVHLPGPPVIDVWYGDNQTFGQLGKPQVWVNIVGNAWDADGVASMNYSLNGGTSLPLSLGPDERRLESTGDFNIDLATADLLAGANLVEITARDTLDNMATLAVQFDYSTGTIWPTSYSIDWSTVDNLQDVVQPVDGKWILLDDRVMTPEIAGYDRVLAIGDVLWDDFEITVPVTIQSVDLDNPHNTCDCNNVGLVMRWQGHREVDDTQPAWGYTPYGALALYRWDSGGNNERLWLASNEFAQIVQDTSGMTLTPGVSYMFKGRAETTPGVGGSLYSFKVWPEVQPEPAAWNLSVQAGEEDLSNGSILLMAHYTHATFGTVTITPLTSPVGVPEATTKVVATGPNYEPVDQLELPPQRQPKSARQSIQQQPDGFRRVVDQPARTRDRLFAAFDGKSLRQRVAVEARECLLATANQQPQRELAMLDAAFEQGLDEQFSRGEWRWQ